jgi:hypothetical protein
LQHDSESVEVGLYDGSELGLKLELALQAPNLDLLLLDEAPLFLKLRVNPVPLNHFPSLKEPPLISGNPQNTIQYATTLYHFAHVCMP